MLEISRQPGPDPLGTTSQGGWTERWRRPLGLEPKEWFGAFQEHEIRVVTRGPLRALLYIDDDCLDSRSPLVTADPKVPLLSARLPSAQAGVRIVQVYSRGVCASRIEVRVSGETIVMNPRADTD